MDKNKPLFNKILVANRGEIACRVFRTAQAMGIGTVAVASDPDCDAEHVRLADEVVFIGGKTSSESYLDIDKILAAIEETKAEAVHPGYGFLSENSDFAETLATRNIAFIGPKSSSIDAMGDKIRSKKIAESAGVNIIRGHPDAVTDPKLARSIADEIGYPVMLKASAGGGGKGMRIAWNGDEIASMLEATMSEGLKSFGDARVFIEKFIEKPRHIESQIIADQHGNIYALPERECSLQRRHQKVIEEAPSPAMSPEQRKELARQAILLSKAVDYQNAGTVEFILAPDGEFYFLEMNTRLQVEHPVTEMVTGLDLVELQIRVAAGEKLELDQDKILVAKGWAVEARLYAESPERGFLPSIGRVVDYVEPCGEGIRVDSGISSGQDVSVYYDPMIAKIIGYGSDRQAAFDRLRHGLNQTVLRGVENNLNFLTHLITRPEVLSGDMSTNMIGAVYPDGFSDAQKIPPNPDIYYAIASLAQYLWLKSEILIDDIQVRNKLEQQSGNLLLKLNQEETMNIQIREQDGEHRFVVILSEEKQKQIKTSWQPGQFLMEGTFDDSPFVARILSPQVHKKYNAIGVDFNGYSATYHIFPSHIASSLKHMPIKETTNKDKDIRAPMAGVVAKILVEEGECIHAGETVVIIEAMKMESPVKSTISGIVVKICVKVGETVKPDTILIELDPCDCKKK